MVKRQKNILLALGWYDYRLHRGIEGYARNTAGAFCQSGAREGCAVGLGGRRHPGVAGRGDELAEFVARQNKPTVDFSFRRPHLHFPRVLEDHAHAAQLVADHFLSRGFAHLSFTAMRPTGRMTSAASGFVGALNEPGIHAFG